VPRKICILGNSHVLALKRFWDAKSNGKSDPDVHFFASSANSATNTRLADGWIAPTNELVSRSWKITSDGHEQVRLDRYAVIILHGYFPSPSLITQHMNGLSSSRSAYSVAFQVRALMNLNPALVHLTALLSSAAIKCPPVIVSQRPSPSVTTEREGFSPSQWSSQASRLDKLFSSMNLRFLAQPSPTLDSTGTTRTEFAKNGVALGAEPSRLGSNATPKDTTHTNERYGQEFFRALGCLEDSVLWSKN